MQVKIGDGWRLGRRTFGATFVLVLVLVLVASLWLPYVIPELGRWRWYVGLATVGLAQLAILGLVCLYVRRASSRILASVMRSRKDASRHEWMQEEALRGITRDIDVLRAEVVRLRFESIPEGTEQLTWSCSDVRLKRVLFVTSNGSGMGHITRCIAIAEAGRKHFSSSILTLSVASGLAHATYPYIASFKSPNTFGARRELWHREFTDRLISIMRTDVPDVVAFDGTVIYSGLEDACRAARIPLIWIRRGLWKGEVDRTQYRSPRLYSDRLIVPSDIGETSSEVVDASVGDVVPPVVIAQRADKCDHHTALEHLGLTPGRRYCLVQVGSASVPGVQDLASFICGKLFEIDPGITPVVFESPVAMPTSAPGVAVIKNAYPLARFLAAFDYAVVAAGYNTVHECIQMGLPALYVPKVDTITDDQIQRACNIAGAGLGLKALTSNELEAGLKGLADLNARQRIARNCLQLPELDGAPRSAEAIGRSLAHLWPVPDTDSEGPRE